MKLEPGKLLREARVQHGLSQERLARRAGTTQSAISRIEQERASPTVKTLAELLRLMGEDLVLNLKPRDAGIDRTQIDERLKLNEGERLDYGIAFANQMIAISPRPKREGWTP